MNRKIRCRMLCLLMVSAVLNGCGISDMQSKDKSVELNPNNPTTITVWNYYNGDQLTAFENLVTEFNETVGAKEGIAVVSVSQGSIDNLAECLMDAVEGKVGAQDVPTMASIYAETGYELQEADALVNLDSYFTEEDYEQYISGFIQEGRMTKDGQLFLFPISKSTECFAVNATDWQAFEKATGITVESVNSIEKLTEAAKAYYEWTDSLTPDAAEDGQALYGRDSVSNYIFIGTKQLGHEMFHVTEEGVKVELDHDTFRTLWEHYYIPYINGYFCGEASHRSEDMKIGNVLALTASTSGVSYLPTEVTDYDDQSHEIDMLLQQQLFFEEAVDKVSVQQGAGYCVMKSTEEEQYAAVQFLRWFTDAERNLAFSAASGYSPVTIEANQVERIEKNFAEKEPSEKNKNIKKALLISADIFTNQKTYTNQPFQGSKQIRELLESALEDTAKADRTAVLAAISEGATREEAVAVYSSETYFEKWYARLCEEVQALID